MDKVPNEELKLAIAELLDANTPLKKRATRIVWFFIIFFSGYWLNSYINGVHRDDIIKIYEDHQKVINLIRNEVEFEKLKNEDAYQEKVNKLVTNKNEEVAEINNNSESKIMDMRTKMEEAIFENAKTKAEFIVEMADRFNEIPNEFAATFNTFPKDPPLLQISNSSKYFYSWSHQINAFYQDTLALHMYIHNTSYCYAHRPIISLKYQQTQDTLISFTATLKAQNANKFESGQVYYIIKSIPRGKKLYGFSIIGARTYDSIEKLKYDTSNKIIYFPATFTSEVSYEIPLIDIPPFNPDIPNFYENQFSVVLNLYPIFY